MAYIVPNSDIWILKGVNLEPTYVHTLHNTTVNGDDANKTASRNLQFQTFCSNVSGYVKYHLTNYSYQRKNRNYIRVKKKIEDLYDCNYMVFRNTSYENRYFYAFITDVEYINDNTTEIKYKIDVMQTWWFDYSLNPCYVEREHWETDVRGQNVLPEPVSVDKYQTGKHYRSGLFYNQPMYIVIVSTANIEDAFSSLMPAKGAYTCGVYNNVNYLAINVTDDVLVTRELIQTLMDNLRILNRFDTIVNMYMCPEPFLPKTKVTENNDERYQTYTESYQNAHVGYITPSVTPNYGSSWTPKNNKMYTYPYCYYTVTNQQGTTRLFKYEDFIGTAQNRFEVFFESSIDPQVILIPVGYMEDELQDASTYFNYDYSLIIKDFPKCTMATNDFLAKIVQSGMSLSMSALSGAIGSASLYNTSVPIMSTQSTANDKYMINGVPATRIAYNEESNPETFERLSGYRDETELEANKAFERTVNSIGLNGNIPKITSMIGNGAINMITAGMDFIFKEYHIRIDAAKQIDDFFTMFGYTTNTIKVPNRNVRRFWTYTKTANCTVDGHMNMNDMDLIQNIYNNGITFWTALSNIGNYSLDNTPGAG